MLGNFSSMATPAREELGGHIPTYTSKSLEQLLLVDSFRVVQLVGVSLIEQVFTSFPRHWCKVEGLCGLFPSLAGRLTIVIRESG